MSDWSTIREMAGAARERQIAALFEDSGRAQTFSAQTDGLLFDFSKTNLDKAALDALIALAEGAGLEARRDAMFAGAPVNETEGRPALHTALRALDGGPVMVDGVDAMADIRATLARMRAFASGVRGGRITAPGGGRYRDVVNIGIGGSDLGPAMATAALTPFHDGPRLHFVANMDAAALHDVLGQVDAGTVLFIVASKSFTTAETMANASAARDWLVARIGAARAGAQFVAVTAASGRAARLSVAPERTFAFADWVGGRYSLWGPVGLGLMLAIGAEHFDAFLRGGQAMDRHFRTAPLAANLPVLLALTGLWHNQACGLASRAVLPYEARLRLLPAYLQQLEMESNGKSVTRDGAPLKAESVPVIWGAAGTDAQHAFFQALHQGTRVVACEFLAGCEGHEPEHAARHRLLLANCLAQSQALMRGQTLGEARARMAAEGVSEADIERLAPHRVFPGNRPSVTLLYPRLTPFVLGQIIALYEHRVFTEGVILGLNSFDQWGVELGKVMARGLAPVLEGEAPASGLDGSTRMLADYIRSTGG